MYKIGGFWSDEDSSKREHCYKIVPLENSVPKSVGDQEWENVYQTLGELGYRFRDAGHSSEYIAVSLQKPISQKHLEQLEDAFSITIDDGTELAFI